MPINKDYQLLNCDRNLQYIEALNCVYNVGNAAHGALAEQGYTMNLSHTVQTGVTLKNIQGFNVTLNKYINVWKHVSPDGCEVGPSYPTKAEALADTTDYAKRAGWLV